MAQIDPQDPSPVDLGCELSLFCSDMGTRPEELEWLMWRKDGEPLVTGGNVVVFPDTGELVLSNLQASSAPVYLHILLDVCPYKCYISYGSAYCMLYSMHLDSRAFLRNLQ